MSNVCRLRGKKKKNGEEQDDLTYFKLLLIRTNTCRGLKIKTQHTINHQQYYNAMQHITPTTTEKQKKHKIIIKNKT